MVSDAANIYCIKGKNRAQAANYLAVKDVSCRDQSITTKLDHHQGKFSERRTPNHQAVTRKKQVALDDCEKFEWIKCPFTIH